MAEGIVVLLEIVDVDHKGAQGLGGLAAGKAALEPGGEKPLIQQTGEGVVVGYKIQLGAFFKDLPVLGHDDPVVDEVQPAGAVLGIADEKAGQSQKRAVDAAAVVVPRGGLKQGQTDQKVICAAANSGADSQGGR